MRRGLIPTRAGKTYLQIGRASSRGAHPHAGGENFWLHWRHVTRAGSSPRGRGKRNSDHPAPQTRGLIPTRAGKTMRCSRRARRSRAHPHAGGENIFPMSVALLGGGSSPRGRGKHCGRLPCVCPGGLIPTRAGKTSSMVSKRPSTWAHPHAGGENTPKTDMLPDFVGSSPRGRGKRPGLAWAGLGWGLIPTRAGKTRRPGRSG